MKIITAALVAICFAIPNASSQGMSDEWHAEKDRSWARTRIDFPQSAYPGHFKDRMLEIDEWAKQNNPELRYNPNKPYIIAQMVQNELDSADRSEKKHLSLSESRKIDERISAVTTNPQASLVLPWSKEKLLMDWLSFVLIFVIFLVIPGLGACIGWAKNAMDRRDYIVRLLLFTLGGSILTAVSEPLAGLAMILFSWMMCVNIGKRLRSMGWPRWSALFAGLPFVPLIVAFWPAKRINASERSKPRDTKTLINNYTEYTEKKDHETFSESDPQKNSAIECNKCLTKQNTMITNEYEVVIPEGNDIGEGYVEMRHNTQYSLYLKNHREVPCDAEVTIDGIRVGTWRVNAHDEIQIERPVHDTGHFTFFKVGTDDAREAGIAKNSNNGLISVLFKPEVAFDDLGLNAAPLSLDGYASGATGLTGESKQRFGNAPSIHHDMARSYTIHLRLVAPREDIRPLLTRSTLIPPPVG